MQLDFRRADNDYGLERFYIAALVLKNFRGRRNVEVQLFRPNDGADLTELRGNGLVDLAPQGVPAEILQGASEEAALGCLLEAFTLSEAEQLADYIGDRYGDQAEKLIICPIELPLPLGVGPLASLPEGENSGFLNFQLAPGYTLPFQMRGYFELA